jgi:hypothetical protein
MQALTKTLDPPMARKKMGRPTSDRNDVAVKMDRRIVAKARYVAEQREITLAEYLSEIVRPVVDKDFEKATKEGAR